MIYFHISIVIAAILVCCNWGDWRHWQKYYSTILYFMIGDFLYLILFNKTILWMYKTDLLNHTLVNLLIIFTVYPSIILVFLPYYPEGILKRIGYILIWTAIVEAMEYLSYWLGCLSYRNGWNLGWSIIFCLIMFPLQHLHYHKPLLAWGLSIIELTIFITIFNVDILSLI